MKRSLGPLFSSLSLSFFLALGGCPSDVNGNGNGNNGVDCRVDPFNAQCPEDCVAHPNDPRCTTNPDNNPHTNGGGPGDSGCTAVEFCNDGFDNNCDGRVDESDANGQPCPCSVEFGQDCYTGPAGTRGVGACSDGAQQCTDIVGGVPSWGACEGEVLPTPETCGDEIDNDCDGVVDNGCVIGAPVVTCPAEINSAPLLTVPVTATATPGPTGAAITSRLWQVTNRPVGSTSNPSPTNQLTTNLFLDVAGDYTMTFTALDADGQSASCSTLIHAIPTENLRIEVSWDKDDTDIDSHLLHPTAGIWYDSTFDCNYRNCDVDPFFGGGLSWGAAGAADDPRLDIDDINGFGPENINIDFPQLNQPYRFGAYYYSDHGNGATNVIVKIFCGGSLAAQFGPQNMLGSSVDAPPNQLWKVADITFTSGTTCQITPLNQIAQMGGSGIPR